MFLYKTADNEGKEDKALSSQLHIRLSFIWEDSFITVEQSRLEHTWRVSFAYLDKNAVGKEKAG